VTQSLAAVAFLVPDADSAIAWLPDARGVNLLEEAAP
jgi:hypothetical protein